MNSRQIEIFHTVMLLGTVTEAAQKLGITQPAVTASLKQIEASLGFNLFHRAGGRLHPTAEAKILFEEAARIQNSLDVFGKLAERLKKDLTTHLRIAAPPVLCHDLIPEAIARFSADRSDCLIDVTTQHHDSILDDVASSVGQNNLGLTFGLDDRPGLGSLLLGRSEIMGLVPVDWPLSDKGELEVQSLEGKPVVGTFAGEPLGNAVNALFEQADIAPNHVTRVHNHSVAANLASKGVGVAIVDSLTATYAQRYFDNGQYQITPVANAPSLPVTAIYSYEHPLNKNARRFTEIFRSCLRAQTAS